MDLENLIQDFSASNFHELELISGVQSVRLVRKKKLPLPLVKNDELETEQAQVQGHSQDSNSDGRHSIYAQRVGFFSPLIVGGSLVKSGDLIGQIKAMNINHEVRADLSGKVASIAVEEGSGVAFGDLLVTLDIL